MRALFLLPGRFAPLGHAIARKLKEEYGVSYFSGITYTDSSYRFLRAQTDVDYAPLLRDVDIYERATSIEVDRSLLDQLEKEYGLPNLWPYIIVDRSLLVPSEGHPSYPSRSRHTLEQLHKLLQAHFSAILSLLDEAKPDFIVGNTPGHMGTLILAHVAKARGIPTLFFGRTRVLNRVTMCYDPYESFDGIYRIYDELKGGARTSLFRAEAKEFLRVFRSQRLFYEGSRTQSRMADLQHSSLAREFPVLFLHAKNVLRSAYDYLCGRRGEKPYPSTPLAVLRRFALIDYRRLTLRRWNGFSLPDDDDDYILYPLHVEPELSLLLLGQPYLDQVNVVQQIAKSLPIGIKLYVKEHPSMFGLRPKAFYQRLLRMPNVRLIHPRVDSHETIRSARAVVTVTGTAGLEAVLFGKPVITLGNAFYSRLDLVHKAHSLVEIPSLITQALSKDKVDDDRVVAMVTAIFEGSVAADYGYLWHAPGGFEEIWSHPHLGVLARLIAQEVGLSPAQPARPMTGSSLSGIATHEAD